MKADVEFGVSDGDTEAVMITGRDETQATLQSLQLDPPKWTRDLA